MIKSLNLFNCQSHKDSKLKFHSGLNILVGDTDAGKSVIIRALDKLLFNSMPSKELISNWADEMTIAAKVDDNDIILHHDKKDSYQLNKINFSAVGTKVPEDIKNVLNVEDINLQNQIDSFFLLNETSGYVAQYLNQIANISQIDSVTKSIKSDLNNTKREIEKDKETVVEKEKELDKYSFLNDFEIKIKEVDTLNEKKLLVDTEIGALNSIIDRIENIDDKILSIGKYLSLKSSVDSALLLFTNKKEAQEQYESLTNLINKLKTADSRIKEISKLVILKPIITSIDTVKENKRILDMKLDSLQNLIDKLTLIEEKLKIANLNHVKEHDKYHSEMKKLDICFFCGSKIK